MRKMKMLAGFISVLCIAACTKENPSGDNIGRRIVKETSYDKNGNESGRDEYVYDGKNYTKTTYLKQMPNSIVEFKAGKNKDIFKRYIYNTGNWSLLATDEIEYSKGRKIRSTTLSASGEETLREEYSYNGNGYEMLRYLYGTLNSRISCVQDDDTETQRIYEAKNGDTVYTGCIVTEFQNGRIVRYTRSNASDEIINFEEYIYSGNDYTMTESIMGAPYRKQVHTVTPEVETYDEYVYDGTDWVFNSKVVREYEN